MHALYRYHYDQKRTLCNQITGIRYAHAGVFIMFHARKMQKPRNRTRCYCFWAS